MQVLTRISLMASLFLLTLNSHAALSEAEINCNKALQQNQPQSAIKQAEQLIEKDANNGNAYICKGRAHFALDQADEALKAFSEAEKTSPDNYNKSFATLLIGHVYKNTGRIPQAIDAYQNSLDYAIKAQHQGLAFSNHMNIGHAKAEMKALDDALNAYLAGYEVAGNDGERADAETKIASIYYAMQDYDKAIEYQLKGLFKLQRVGTLDQYAVSLVDYVTYQTTAKRLADAERYANKLIKFAQDNGGIYYEAKGQLLLAQIKSTQNELGAAQALLTKAKVNANKVQDAALTQEIEGLEATLTK